MPRTGTLNGYEKWAGDFEVEIVRLGKMKSILNGTYLMTGRHTKVHFYICMYNTTMGYAYHHANNEMLLRVKSRTSIHCRYPMLCCRGSIGFHSHIISICHPSYLHAQTLKEMEEKKINTKLKSSKGPSHPTTTLISSSIHCMPESQPIRPS